MNTQFIVGNSYSIDEIEGNGFINTKTTKLVLFYRKNKILLAFNLNKPSAPKTYQLISFICD